MQLLMPAHPAPTTMDSSVRDVLRVGAYQLLFMRIPSHAAVDETVSLAREVAGMGASKFC